MTAPNIKQPSSVIGKTAVHRCTTLLTSVLQNNSNSNKVYKVNAIRASNIDTSLNIDVDVTYFRSSSHSYIASSITIPVKSTLVVLSKEEYIWLEEGDAIYAKASTAAKIDLTIHYEEIS